MGANSTQNSIVVSEQVEELSRQLVELQYMLRTMADPEGHVILGEAKAQQAAECYAKVEAELQALRQQNEELRSAVREQQEQVATERLREDRRSRAQMQDFANFTAELLVGRQGPQAQFKGVRLNIKVEKPDTYDGDKAKDLVVHG